MATSGWNRPSANKPITPRKNNSVAKGLIAGLIVVIVAAIAAYFIFSSSERKPTKEIKQKKNAQIAEVTPAAAQTYQESPKPEEPKPEIRVLEDGRLMKYHPDGSPAWAYPRKPESAHPVTNGLRRVKTFEEEVFANSSDVEIAWLLTTEPGEQIIGDYDYSRNFEKRFLADAEKPIVIAPDDPDNVKELKQAVIDVRKEMMLKYKLGENVADIMAESRKELQEVGLYREELKEQIRQMAKEGGDELSEDDAKDLVKAANKMLEERGAKPIKMPAFLKYQFQQMYHETEGGNVE